MKCDIAKDLLLLYTDNLCSPETVTELEEHLSNCEACSKLLVRYKSDLTEKSIPLDNRTYQPSPTNLNPFKKVHQKMLHQKVLALILGLVLIGLISVIGVLSYGQFTNKCISFSMLADVLKLNSITNSFAHGDTEPLIENMSFYMEEYYFINGLTEFESFDSYKAYLKTELDTIYQTYYKELALTPKLIDISISPYYNNSELHKDYIDEANTYYVYCFYDEKQEPIFHMTFSKMSENQFRLYPDPLVEDDAFKRNFTEHLPYNDIIMTVGLRYPFNDNFTPRISVLPEHPGMYIAIGVRKHHGDSAKERACQLEMEKEIDALCDAGLRINDALFSIDDFDIENNYWIYKVWFSIQNEETQKTAILQCRFALLGSCFYIIPEETPEVISGADAFTPEQLDQFIKLFTY